VRAQLLARATQLSLLYFALATASLIWPIYPWIGNHIEPRVLGLPWSLVWVLIVITCNFLVLTALFRLRVIDDREADS
jgi:hypothetical protein